MSDTFQENTIKDKALQEIFNIVPIHENFILVDECQWGIKELEDRKAIPFLENNGHYWGPPSDDAAGIAEVERQYENRVSFIIFGEPAFWWLEYYKGMKHYLDTWFVCLANNEKIVAYDLRKKKPSTKFSNCISEPGDRFNLVLFDDFLPNLKGSWRSAEMVYYLKNLEGVRLVCMENFYGTDAHGMMEADSTFESDKQRLIEKYDLHHLEEVIVSVNNSAPVNVNARLAYCLFYNNLRDIYDEVLEKFQIPFVFTLYPGGGFKIYNMACENFLRKINASPLFRGVIVTQQVTLDYIVDRRLIDAGKVLMIYGSPYELEKYQLAGEKRYYKKHKETLDVCFVSAKYIANGLDKGFDVFSQVAYKLSQKYDFIRFHVVGGFSREDLLYDVPAEQIHFYGYQYFEWFKKFYCDIDAIVSPVKPHVLSWGAFDGFPTGAVEEAGFFGALMISSDPMGDNVAVNYKNWEEIVIVESNHFSVIQSIEKLISEPALIEQIGTMGKKRLAEVYATDVQLGKRLSFLTQAMTEQ